MTRGARGRTCERAAVQTEQQKWSEGCRALSERFGAQPHGEGGSSPLCKNRPGENRSVVREIPN